jgi:NADPH:quinone reductase-like Zn-dependent oxidoreductase
VSVRAIVCSPSSPDRIAFRDLPEPIPADDECGIAVRAASLNRGEFRRLQWEVDGWRPGYDVAGEVVEAARGEPSGPPVGTRVVGVLPNGAWAERVAVPVRHVARIPDAVPFEAAATVPVAGLTSLAALNHGGPLLRRRVLVTGAAGGVGRFAIQLAAMRGAAVTALVRNADRGLDLDRLGADPVLTDLATDGPEFDFILESVGGPTLGIALGRLGMDGTLVSIGGSSDTLTTIDGLAFARKGPITMYGMSLFRELERQGMGARDLDDLLALVADGRLDPQVARVASWREMGPLLRALGAREINGKAVALID